ncbi:hypothetical protein H072_3346 [Dactylellina haptotyla CBS 200.50]|uniref:Uncharacterized protein n=1 Tax=Dactylellina haptotyla (strain CBS 200.50) TaxID=1284197 RepID=S8AI76_DACHA|nr:hypothetical protein H072_3346 [Dactylellina haptotyla CBS 200.50]
MGSLKQDFYLGTLPAGLQFTITEAKVFCQGGGYSVEWRDRNNFNASNMDGRCYSGGAKSNPIDPTNKAGKTCVFKTNFTNSMPNAKPVRLGATMFKKNNTLDFLAQEAPGKVTLSFQISKIKGNKRLASGTLEVAPARFKTLGRPDNIDVTLTWSNGKTEKTQTNIAGDIGVDPPAVHLLFVKEKGGKKLGMAFTQNQPLLNKIASVGVQGLLYANKKLVEYGIPGGKVILTVVDLPETIDTARDTVDGAKDTYDAAKEGNLKQAFINGLGTAKNGFDVIGGVRGVPGDLRGAKKGLDRVNVGKTATKNTLKKVGDDLKDDAKDKLKEKAQEGALQRRMIAPGRAVVAYI